MGLDDFGLDLGGSNPDFVKLAEAFGAHGYVLSEWLLAPAPVDVPLRRGALEVGDALESA